MSGPKTTCHCVRGRQIFVIFIQKVQSEILCNGKVAKFQNNILVVEFL